MKALILLIACTLATAGNVLYGQRSCATMEVYNDQIIKDSLFRYNRRTIEIFNERFKINNANKMLTQFEITIPVVVHIVLTDPSVVTREQIESQIKVLNEDFSATNRDRSKVPDLFKPSAANDLGIKFALAIRDPKGNRTNGIQVIKTTRPSFNADNDVKFSALGGADAWPSNQYLNIWVCNLDDNLLGYAQFPGGPMATDGVVISHHAFGTTGSAKPPFHKGRTATHEVGHWLDLFHIWGDDGNACTGDDLVDDTPNQGGPNYQCPTFPHKSCNNGNAGDMFMNYMDYVNDECMVLFSKGQGFRIRATLQNYRSSMMVSAGLIAPSVQLNAKTETKLNFNTY